MIQRPAVIIEAHGHAQVVRVLNAQILNFVARLRDRIAEASQNHRRNPRVSRNSATVLACSYLLFSSGKVVVPR